MNRRTSSQNPRTRGKSYHHHLHHHHHHHHHHTNPPAPLPCLPSFFQWVVWNLTSILLTVCFIDI